MRLRLLTNITSTVEVCAIMALFGVLFGDKHKILTLSLPAFDVVSTRSKIHTECKMTYYNVISMYIMAHSITIMTVIFFSQKF